MDYLGYWQLRERPFENNGKYSFFYPGREHIEALERLLYLVQDGNMHFGLLTGEIGAGKSMVIRQLDHKLDKNKIHSLILPNGNLEFIDILCEVIHHLEVRPGGRGRREQLAQMSRYELHTRFSELLQDKIMRLDRSLVIMIDEAQQLSEKTLIELKNLTNLGAFDRNAITIILGGQPELAELIHKLPSIDQRVGLRFHLSYLTQEGVGEYIDYQVSAAGYPGGSIFPADAKDVLYDFTGGTPREINRICKLALDRSYTMGQRTVSANVLRNIAVDVFQQDSMVKQVS